MIVDSRLVGLNILRPPTLENVIRGYSASVYSESKIFSVTIPSNTRTGDLILLLRSHKAHYVYAPEDVICAGYYWHETTAPSDWTYYYGNASITEADGNVPSETLRVEAQYKVAAGTTGEISTDAGTTVSFTISEGTNSPSCTGLVTADHYHYSYIIVLNGTYITELNELETSEKNTDGYDNALADMLYWDDMTVTQNNSLVIQLAAIEGNVNVEAAYPYVEMVKDGSSELTMYLMMAMAGAGSTGLVFAQPDSEQFFAGLSLEARL